MMQSNRRFLVTAGNTRERIDRVRDWGNIFTGGTGYSIARALATIGEVDLLTSNRAHLDEAREKFAGKIHGQAFTSHADLKSQLAEKMRSHQYDAVVMTAAIADYKPARVYAVIAREPVDSSDPGGHPGGHPDGHVGQERWIVQDVQAGKVKSTHQEIAVLGQQTEKLVDLFRSEWGYTGTLVKFKLEVGLTRDELLKVAEASRKSSDATYLVANTLDMVEGPEAGAYLLSDAGAQWIARSELPATLLGLFVR